MISPCIQAVLLVLNVSCLIQLMMVQRVCICDEMLIMSEDIQIKNYILLFLKGRWVLVCRFGNNERDMIKSFSFKMGQEQFLCSFQRTVTEEYKTSLDQLVDIIDSGSRKEAAEDCWICVYKIYSFSCKRIIEYQVGNLQYGQKISIKGKGKMENCVVSNCFRMNNFYYYFANREKTEMGSGMDMILDERYEKILGLCIKIGDLVFCLPISQILQGNSTLFAIEKSIESTIKKVVYISHEGSYCTGILFSPTYILTVKHLFNIIKPLGTIIDVRFYPYQTKMKAKVCGFIAEYLDLMILSISQDNEQEDICDFFSMVKQQNIPLMKMGMKVYAIGFGKYPYLSHYFDKVDLFLPTIDNGIISKVIEHNKEQVYFKTDMQIYNGYSGCPIWHQSHWIGTAFFIVRNPISSAKHPRHNFSFCRRFIQSFRQNHGVEGSKSNIESFLRQFQAISTRKQLTIVPKL